MITPQTRILPVDLGPNPFNPLSKSVDPAPLSNLQTILSTPHYDPDFSPPAPVLEVTVHHPKTAGRETKVRAQLDPGSELSVPTLLTPQ
jgi:hypothetical protein